MLSREEMIKVLLKDLDADTELSQQQKDSIRRVYSSLSDDEISSVLGIFNTKRLADILRELMRVWAIENRGV